MPNNSHNANNRNTPPDDAGPDDASEQQLDERIRRALGVRPSSAAQAADTATNSTFERRVFAKVRRRQVAARAAFAASLFILLSVGWQLRSGLQDSQRSDFAAQEQTPADSINTSEDFAAFAAVYQSDLSPVAQLETLENEPRALLRYLDALAATREQE